MDLASLSVDIYEEYQELLDSQREEINELKEENKSLKNELKHRDDILMRLFNDLNTALKEKMEA